MNKKILMFIVIIFSVISLNAGININNNSYIGYTSNIYKNSYDLSDNYFRNDLMLFYNNKEFSIETFFEYMKYFDYEFENYNHFNIEPKYILPISLYTDLIFKAGFNDYIYNNYKYMNNYDYKFITTFKYDTLFSLRNLVSFQYENKIFQNNNLDYEEFSIYNNLYYYISVETILNLYINYSITSWNEKNLWLDSNTVSEDIPKDNKLELETRLEHMLSDNLIATIYLNYENQTSELSSIITVDNTEKFEKDIYSYNLIEIGNSFSLYYNNWSFLISNSFAFKKYNERKIITQNLQIGDDKVYNNIYNLDINVEKSFSPAAGLDLNFNYEKNDSNDFYINGSGYNIEGGIYFQF